MEAENFDFHFFSFAIRKESFSSLKMIDNYILLTGLNKMSGLHSSLITCISLSDFAVNCIFCRYPGNYKPVSRESQEVVEAFEQKLLTYR